MTLNNLEINELLVRAANLLPKVSQEVRDKNLARALTVGSELEWCIKNINWRVWELTNRSKDRT